MNIAELVLRHAHQGDADAVVEYESGRRQSFSALDDRVRRLFEGIADQFRLRRGDRVAVLSRNSMECMEILLACALRGFLVQALNWRLSVTELGEILRADTPKVLLYHEEFHREAEQLGSLVDCSSWVGWSPDGSRSELESLVERTPYPAMRRDDEAGDDDPSLVVYTGGTTGVSKGAVHTHRTAAAAMAQNTVGERVVPTDRFLLMGQMFHSPVILAVNYLTHGCPVIMVNFKPELALAAVQEERITTSMGIPTMFQNMIPPLSRGDFDVSSLRNVQYGGSPIAKTVVRELMDLLGCGLLQCYGRTEELAITFLSQEDHVRAVADVFPERLDSCGREAWLTRIVLVDESGRPIPRSSRSAGEVVESSPGAMISYLGQPDLTAEATYRLGWLRTGDVGRFDEHGYLYIVGRAKELIISGGENIYPAQVELAIQRNPAVLDVAVVGVPDELRGESVKAYVVARPGIPLTEADVIAAAVSNLGSYQKPRFVEFLDEMPTTPTGKIDKVALRKRARQRARDDVSTPSVETHDAVLVGASAVSLFAGITLARGGYRPLVVEKSDVVGGGTAYSGGIVWAPDNHRMRAKGIPDSAEDALRHLDAVSLGRGDAQLARAYVDTIVRVLLEVEEFTTLKWVTYTGLPDYFAEMPGGRLNGRFLLPLPWEPRAAAGDIAEVRALRSLPNHERSWIWVRALIGVLYEAALDLGVVVRTRTRAIGLIGSAEGVSGVRVLGPDGSSGTWSPARECCSTPVASSGIPTGPPASSTARLRIRRRPRPTRATVARCSLHSAFLSPSWIAPSPYPASTFPARATTAERCGESSSSHWPDRTRSS